MEAGRLDVRRLLTEEKLKVIERQLVSMKDKPLGAIKDALGDDYSYGEIRIVQAHRKYLTARGATKEPPA